MREKKKQLQTKDCSEDTLLRWKKSLGNGEWGHFLKIKTKGYQKKGSGEWGNQLREKKRQLQKKDCGKWRHTFEIKKILGKWWVRTYFEDENKRLPKKKDLVTEDIYWEKKRLLQTKDRREWGHTFGIRKNPWEMVIEDILWR